ncbi:hypothetical protein [Budvicia aquatica]|uniref:Uncharacterized protein n=1 Tax=Budvicia aquatica TaxID=82979 RepID=A0A484ZHX4_9GAMM|nr:hypothetical protein [Budvicia aquatica]VFS48167.1 Uncharacterised protein [Budvicia aquatica]
MNQITTQRFALYQLIFGWMNFVLVIPGIYLLLGLPLTMREYGWSGTDIGFSNWQGYRQCSNFCWHYLFNVLVRGNVTIVIGYYYWCWY